MHNPYIEYYQQQAGTGIAAYGGVRYQRGHGFFGRLLSKAVYPLLRFFGKQAVGTAANIASDVILNKINIKDSANKRLAETGENIVREGVEKAKTLVQEGEGGKHRRRGRAQIAIMKKNEKTKQNKKNAKKSIK